MPRVLLVGFDGAVLDLAERFAANGTMPTLSSLWHDGAYGEMRSVYPYNSAVAWTSVATGVNPGRHGVFDFVLPARDSYALRVATREDRLVPAVWNHVVEAGGRAAVVNIPMTFPAEPIDGAMVSGMDAPALDERAAHPASLLSRARSHGYRIVSGAGEAAPRGDWERAERELVSTLAARAAFARELGEARDVDLLMVNLESTDGAHHYFWQHLDPSHPRHDSALAARWGGTVERIYSATDHELGRLIDAYAPDTVFVVSDHGGGPSNDWVLFMNDWLADSGFLSRASGRASATISRRLYAAARERIPEPVRHRIRGALGATVERAKGAALYGDVDWPRSRAYAQMQSGIRVNLAGREPGGVVSQRDASAVLDEIAAAAAELRLPDGERAFRAILRSDGVYAGDAAGGWDLVLERHPGLHVRSRNTTGVRGALHRLSDLGMYLPSGLHTDTGMVAAAGAGIARVGRADRTDVHQVTPSVLAALGVAAPALDGLPFPFVEADLQTTGDRLETTDAQGTEFSSDEEDEILDRLRALGYVD